MSRLRLRRFDLAVSLLVLVTLAAPVPVAASIQPRRPEPTKLATSDSRPDLDQSVVQTDPPRTFQPMKDIQLATADDRAPHAVVADPAPEAQSEFTRTTDNGDGSLTTTFSSHPLQWQDEGGSWLPFDNAISAASQTDAAAGFAFANRSGPFSVRFAAPGAASADGRLLHLDAGKNSVDLYLPGARPSALTKGTGAVTFADALPAGDVRYRLLDDTLREEIVVRQAPTADAPLAFTFELGLDGLSASQRKDGSIALLDAQSRPAFIIPASFMLDGDTEKPIEDRYSSDVVTTLEPLDGGRVRVTLTPDAAWLADPVRVYPLIVDPTFHYTNYRTDTSGSASVMIDEGNTTTNYYGAASVTVGKDAAGKRLDALVRFPDIDVLPRDATIIGSVLSFDPTSGTSGMVMAVHRATSSWNATTVTYSTAPSSTNYNTFTSSLGVNSITMTGLVDGWMRGTMPNQGMRLRGEASIPNGQQIVIPATGTGSPSLSVSYIKQLRLGVDPLYTYASQDFGGGTSAQVNAATGNLVLQHDEGAIGAPGFSVDLTSTFNGQDPFGQHKAAPDSWAVYGEGWSFSQDLRVLDTAYGAAVLFKDGTGRIRVYNMIGDTSGVRSYRRPLEYGYTLTKDVNASPAVANKIFTLTADQGGEKLWFDAAGKLTKRQDRNGNYLTYAYDGSGRLTTITDKVSRTTTLDYGSGSGSPSRLYRITDMAGRISQFAYDAYGNLVSVKDAQGTADERITTFGYTVADQLTSVTNPTGNTFNIDYGILHGWDTAGSVENWAMASGSTGTVAQSTTQHYTGTGSLKLTLGSAGYPLADEVVETYTPAKVWNSAPQELIAYIYLAAGAPAINVTLRASQACSSGSQTATAALTAGGWNEVHLESVDLDPSCPLAELGIRFVTPGSQTYTTPIYVDHLYFRGLTMDVTDASASHVHVLEWAYDPANLKTTVAARDAAGTMQPTTYRYTDIGQVDQITDPYSNVTTTTYDSDWRAITIDYPGSASDMTLTYPSGVFAWQTETVAGATSHQGVDATTSDLRYEIDAINEARRLASQSYLGTIYNRDSAGNVTTQKLNWYAASANLDTVPFPTASSTVTTTTYTYMSDGQVATVTDPNGIVAKDEYDTADRQTKAIDNYVSVGSAADQNLTTLMAYDQATVAGRAGLVTKRTAPDGGEIAYTYDALGRQLTQVATGTGLGSGITTTTTTDANGSTMTETLDAVVTERTYDVNGRLTKAILDKGTGKLNLTTEYAYDALGNQTAVKDPRGIINRSFYDANGRLSTSVQNCTTTGTTIPSAWATCTGAGTADATWNLTTTYLYDANGNQTEETAPNGRDTRHGFDTANRLALLAGIRHDHLSEVCGQTARFARLTSTPSDRSNACHGSPSGSGGPVRASPGSRTRSASLVRNAACRRPAGVSR
jgi:YD repeat-containing protein